MNKITAFIDQTVHPHVIRLCADDSDDALEHIIATLIPKRGKDYEAITNELVRRWNAFEEGGLVEDLVKACEESLRFCSGLVGKHPVASRVLKEKLQAALALHQSGTGLAKAQSSSTSVQPSK